MSVRVVVPIECRGDNFKCPRVGHAVAELTIYVGDRHSIELETTVVVVPPGWKEIVQKYSGSLYLCPVHAAEDTTP
jgi:hypothetical protein